jgi:hypothetical membrane protein
VSASAPPPNAAARRWFSAAAVGVVLYVVLDVIAQLLPPHYSPISQAESDLAVGPYGYVMTANFVLRGVLTFLFVVGLATLYRAEGSSWRRSRGGFVALGGVWGVGALLLAAFPTDVPSTPVSPHGAVHLLVALLAFLGGAIGIYLLSLGLEASPTLRSARTWALPLAIFSLVACVVELTGGLFLPHISERVGGLLERIFLGSVLLWILLVSLAASRRVRPAAAPEP